MDLPIEKHGKRQRCPGQGHLVSFINAILFCSAISLNLWALRRSSSCRSLTVNSTSDGHRPILDDHCQIYHFLTLCKLGLTLLIDPLARLSTFESVIFEAELFSTSIYKGVPRQELDDAWNQLVDRMCSLLHAPS
jgi:hypothetical protein